MSGVGRERLALGRDGRNSLSPCGPGFRTTAATMMPAAAAPVAHVHGVWIWVVKRWTVSFVDHVDAASFIGD